MAQEMYRELRLIKRIVRSGSERGPALHRGAERQVLHRIHRGADRIQGAAQGRDVPIATQRRSIYFEPNSAKMSLDSRAVVDEIGGFMRAYENTVVDIDGNTDSTGSRELNMRSPSSAPTQ